jgi:hypothetical protein
MTCTVCGRVEEPECLSAHLPQEALVALVTLLVSALAPAVVVWAG